MVDEGKGFPEMCVTKSVTGCVFEDVGENCVLREAKDEGSRAFIINRRKLRRAAAWWSSC